MIVLPPVTVIAALSRPHRAMAVLEAYARQEYAAPTRLLIVESGSGVGSVDNRNGVPGLHVIRAGASSAEARNAGLDWLRDHGAGPWAMMDDDDYYGPGYLTEQISGLAHSGAAIVGKTWHYVMFPDGLYRVRSGREYCLDPGPLTGGTLCGRSALGMPRFERRYDDDIRWCMAAKDLGLRAWATGRNHYCYDRSVDEPRTWEAGPHTARRALAGEGGECDYYGALPLSAVDDPFLRPARRVPAPTSRQILSEVSAW